MTKRKPHHPNFSGIFHQKKHPGYWGVTLLIDISTWENRSGLAPPKQRRGGGEEHELC